jgi:hypothetical protein
MSLHYPLQKFYKIVGPEIAHSKNHTKYVALNYEMEMLALCAIGGSVSSLKMVNWAMPLHCSLQEC